MQYYPPTFACHTSMTGKIKLDSTSEDYTSRDDDKRPYVFGYDFQTTSDETTPRGNLTLFIILSFIFEIFIILRF